MHIHIPTCQCGTCIQLYKVEDMLVHRQYMNSVEIFPEMSEDVQGTFLMTRFH